jgi:K+-sensing histidine kinase KdpD
VAQIVRILIDNAPRPYAGGNRDLRQRDARQRKRLPGRARSRAGDPPHRAATHLEPFFTSDDAQGSGLGLAIARELAERMSGHLRVESVPGRTEFTLSFRREARALAGGLVAVAALAGCGGSDSKAPEDTRAGPAAPPPFRRPASRC